MSPTVYSQHQIIVSVTIRADGRPIDARLGRIADHDSAAYLQLMDERFPGGAPHREHEVVDREPLRRPVALEASA